MMPASTWAVKFFSSIHNIRFWEKEKEKKQANVLEFLDSFAKK